MEPQQPEIKKIISTQEFPVSIELSRSTKGVYSWTLKAYGKDFNTTIDVINKADSRLVSQFPVNIILATKV